uniref:Retrovirus-related Pol polyprotein from transposon TNT 1-94 n=1 Tax=Tanacetum cinerariifolium TaxID=118510 RepID=A0A699H4H7_TANCI|nr:retrovirus-related Pol polyprotein from transposon TNT 1-94 [Tanacetum cinerariifolium]
MNPEEKLRSDDEIGRVDESLYRSLIGKLIYVTHSCPGLSFTVGVLSRFMHNPSKQHFGAAKRVLRYLAGTMKLVDDGKSTTGNCFILGPAAISWSSKKQDTTTISVTEAEYISASATSCQAVWLRRLMSDLRMKQLKQQRCFVITDLLLCLQKIQFFITVLNTSTSNITLIAKGEVKIESCRSEEQLADIMTKGLAYSKHEDSCTRLDIMGQSCDLVGLVAPDLQLLYVCG